MQIVFENVNFKYGKGTVFEEDAINDVSFAIKKGEFIGLIGHTGSGKSTLIQHMNGLLKATTGRVLFNGQDIYGEKYKLSELRGKVGLVFQYPEHQLFETTVFKDVSYGPKNLKLDKDQVESRTIEALKMVGIGKDLYQASPFELSGGQKRRVAIAGVLAMKPEVLILDEPTAGLDPGGRNDILKQIAKYHKEGQMTIILVSHNMEDIAMYVDRVMAMKNGELILDGTTKEVFKKHKQLEGMDLAAPQINYLVEELNKKGFEIPNDILTVKEARDEILKKYRSQY